MNPEVRENFRLILLSIFAGSKGWAVPQGAIRAGLPVHLRRTLPEDVWAELDYLVSKGFLVQTHKAISPENAEWKITAEGRDFLASEGLL